MAENMSPLFREDVRVILKVSHNLHASTLPLLLHPGRGVGPQGPTSLGRPPIHRRLDGNPRPPTGWAVIVC